MAPILSRLSPGGGGGFGFGRRRKRRRFVGIFLPSIGGDISSSASVRPTFTTSTYLISGSIGEVGTHTSTDWQISTNPSFSSIVAQSLNDTTNLTSWTPYVSATNGRLNGNTTYYVRCRHRSSLGLISDYSNVQSLTTIVLNENYTNGSQTINRPSSGYTTFTVPANTGRIRVTLYGNYNSSSVKGGRLKGTFNVIPGEQLRVYNVGGAISLWENEEITNPDSQRALAIAVCGNAGGYGRYYGYDEDCDCRPEQIMQAGGNGGGSVGAGAAASGGNPQGYYAGPSTGGTQSGPGTGGKESGGNGNGPGAVGQGGDGSGMYGGSGGYSANGDPNNRGSFGYGGSGGAGWYGGGGGGSVYAIRDAGGAGGSSRFQTPSSRSWRSGSQIENVQGGADSSGIRIVFEY